MIVGNPDITFVRIFIAVAENASMTVAANALHLMQGIINQQIEWLEDALECRLFECDGRRLELIHAGERFLDRTKRLLAPNDGIWADMAARPLQDPVRLGALYDLVGTVFPSIFRASTETWPSVKLTIVCGTSPGLTERTTRSELDVVVVEAPVDEATGECLCVERPVWVGSCGGNVYVKRPLLLSMVDESCTFRTHVLKALGEHGIEWCTVFESSNTEATTATVRTGLVVTAWLTPTVPADPDILEPEASLPELPMFAISPPLPAQGASAAALTLAQCVRDGFSPW